MYLGVQDKNIVLRHKSVNRCGDLFFGLKLNVLKIYVVKLLTKIFPINCKCSVRYLR